MAITKKQKQEITARYSEWLEKSKAVVLAEYTGLNMKDFDALRAQVREAGGEFHVVKNTLMKRVLVDAGMEVEDENFIGSTAIGFAFEDAPALAKALSEFAKSSDFLKVKAGYLDAQHVSAAGVESLANLPPLPVMRATLLSTILAPATQLVRTFSEPGRQVAAVLKAFSEKDAAPEAA